MFTVLIRRCIQKRSLKKQATNRKLKQTPSF
jgi:hypothetical protein